MPSLRKTSVSKWLTRSPGHHRLEDGLHGGTKVLGEQLDAGSADDLLGAVAEDPFRGVVPTGDARLGVMAEDPVVGRLEDRVE